LFDHSEYALYAVDRELRAAAPDLSIAPILGNVQDEAHLRELIRRHRVQTVYHAAAYKHVPLVEINPKRGVLNNVFGSLAVARAALAERVQTCVLVSTDKAVRPTNIMGASKRVAELIFQAAAQRSQGTVFSMVRFGNVLGSSGSVVPLFAQQIEAGGPITITHPEVVRYFMLISEAAQLVIQAGAMARGGDVFVLDMGEPVRIVELARSMIRLAGLRERTADTPDGDIGVEIIGLRPGEKLFEELLIGADVQPSGHPRILCAAEHMIAPGLLDKLLDGLHQACDTDSTEAVARALRTIVPEFRDADDVNAGAILRRSNA
jgi:FlaA1/EpsC-like NDP-sugar epimerase